MDMGIDLELCPVAMYKTAIDAYCSDAYNMTAEVGFLFSKLSETILLREVKVDFLACFFAAGKHAGGINVY